MTEFAQELNIRREKAVYAARRFLTGLFRRAVFDKNIFSRRSAIAWLYIGGGKSGIEIGAAHNPTRLAGSVRVKYVDIISKAELLRQMDESGGRNGRPPVEVDIISAADTLENIPDSSQDFVIANHVLEHCEDPIGAVGNMLRTLNAGGILFLSIPDKRFSFDSERDTTALEHLVRDYTEGAEISRRRHFVEWAKCVEKYEEDAEAEKRADELMGKGYSTHYHVWTQTEIMEFFVHLKRTCNFNFEIEHFSVNDIEVVVVLRKAG